MLLAHIRQSDFTEQSVQTHLEEVAFLARHYGTPSNLGAHAELAGFLHDMGKFTEKFSRYIKNAVLKDEVATKKIDHSTAGAKYLYDNYYKGDYIQLYVVEVVGMAVLSHHSGLQNFVQLDLKPSDYLRRVTNKELPNYKEVVDNFEAIDGNIERVEQLIEEAKNELKNFLKNIKSLESPIIYFNLMHKLVFSCLIDADRTNTRCFEENTAIHTPISDDSQVFERGYIELMNQVKKWEQHKTTTLNQLRNKMSEKCDISAEKESSIYRLSVPTGGGKTIASLRYALKHAKLYSKSRIIYVVPYTTILEQNAAAVRTVIKQPTNVLEHHANVIDDDNLDDKEDTYQNKHHKQLQLARDNWDFPIIFTTMVQYLDAFYQKGTRKSRRLHNLTNSIIIFDEVQSVPYQHTSLFNATVNFLNTIGNSSVLLCTATQPAPGIIKPSIVLKENAEIVPNLSQIVEAFQRVVFHNKIEPDKWNTEKIANFVETLMEDKQSALIILNTKTAVRKLYERLSEQKDMHVFHLSTSMCPAHRTEQLNLIKYKLGKEKVICISTQLIEAGVDISFETVVRSLAGLDSIAQAAGRCNRNAEVDKGDVYIIQSKDESLSELPEIRIGGEVTLNYILSDEYYANNLLSPEAIAKYFKQFQAQADREITISPKGLNYKLIDLLNGAFASKKQLETRSVSMFKTIESYFEAISSPTTSVLVPYGKKGRDIIAGLNEEIADYAKFNQLIKEAQQYSVNLYTHELQRLDSDNLIEVLYNDSIYCLNEKAYSEEFGVSTEGEAKLEPELY